MVRGGCLLVAVFLSLVLPGLARADDGFVGTYRLSGREGVRALQGTVVIRATGSGLALSGSLGSRGQVELTGACAGDEASFAPEASAAPTAGLVGALAGGDAPASDAAATISVRLRANGPGKLRGEVVDGAGRRLMTLELTRRRRALIVHATGHGPSHDNTFKSYGGMIRTYYAALGMQVVMLPAASWATVLAELVRAGDDGEPYVRVVTLGHGGWDGPIFGGQLSPWMSASRWSELVDAVRRGTAPEAKLLVSACHAAGSNRWESWRPHDRWVERLARAAGRTVAGPAGITSTTFALRHARALEGAGTFAQETRLAAGDGVRAIPSGGGIRSGKRLTWEQVDAAASAP
ncbi:MAG: hypothetical protein M9894_22825 [Planctomycetes bacterium]|nr:hypothetical protein [Planctomycetota bacterium]